MEVSANIFRKYDIRGVYPEELNEELFLYLGRALGTYIQRQDPAHKNIVIGRDDRESSIFLFDTLAKGLLASGMNVTYVGVLPFPAIHYLVSLDSFDVGAMVTASHNPSQFNGLKIDYRKALPFHGEDLQSLREIVETEDFISGNGIFKEQDMKDDYIRYTAGTVKLQKSPKVVVNCGNGATSPIVEELFSLVGADLVEMFCSLDSTFPHNIPNPDNKDFMNEVSNKVVEVGADIGFGFDGDGDRLGVVDETGKFHSIDRVMAVLLEEPLRKNKGVKVLYDVKSSQVFPNFVKKVGGDAIMAPTGRSTFLKNIINGDAMFGIEYSGHTFFKDESYGYDDALYTACRVLRLLDSSGKKFSEIMNNVPELVSTPEIKVPCPDEKKTETVTRVVEKVKLLKDSDYPNWDVNTIDGVRVQYSEFGWFLIRSSNTSPYLSVRVEGSDMKNMLEGWVYVRELLKTYSYLDHHLLDSPNPLE